MEWLLERRYVRAIGVDSLSPDPGASTTFELHRRLLAADRCGLENVANLQHIAPRGPRPSSVSPLGVGLGWALRVLGCW